MGEVTGTDWVTVDRFSHRPPALLLAAHLEGSGIPTRVHGDDAGGVYGPVSFHTGVEVLVPADRLGEAVELRDAAAYDEVRDGPLGDV